jgi:hypothetical protein
VIYQATCLIYRNFGISFNNAPLNLEPASVALLNRISRPLKFGVYIEYRRPAKLAAKRGTRPRDLKKRYDFSVRL